PHLLTKRDFFLAESEIHRILLVSELELFGNAKLSVSSSLRTQGPITSGASDTKAVSPSAPSEAAVYGSLRSQGRRLSFRNDLLIRLVSVRRLAAAACEVRVVKACRPACAAVRRRNRPLQESRACRVCR